MKWGWFLTFFLITQLVHGQDNLQIQFGYRGSVAAAKHLPSTQRLEGKKFEFVMEYNLWVANRSVTYSSIRSLIEEKRITNRDIDKIIDELNSDNKIGLGQDFLVMGMGFHHRFRGQPVIWSLTITDRFMSNFIFPRTLPQLVWQGNRQFEGTTVDLSKTSLVGLYFREFSVGAARPFIVKDDWSLTVGLRLNYYMGLSGVFTPKSAIHFTTEVGAESLALDYDVEVLHSGVEDFNLFKPRGWGLGANLGATLAYGKKWQFDLGITDLGSIKYNRTVVRIENVDNVFYDGLDRKALDDPEAFADSLINIFDSNRLLGDEFKVPIGAKLSLMASYTFGRTLIKHGPKTLYFFYRQGFKELSGVTTQPKFTLALHRPVFRHWHIGISTSWGGFNGYAVGGMVGIEFKRVRFGLHSDDFTGLIAPERTTGAGGGMIFQVTL